MTKASWADLHREPKQDEELAYNSIRAILRRIGDTADGKMLREWLRVTKVHSVPSPKADDSALRQDAADRRIALQFFNLLEPSGERSDVQRKRSG